MSVANFMAIQVIVAMAFHPNHKCQPRSGAQGEVRPWMSNIVPIHPVDAETFHSNGKTFTCWCRYRFMTTYPKCWTDCLINQNCPPPRVTLGGLK